MPAKSRQQSRDRIAPIGDAISATVPCPANEAQQSAPNGAPITRGQDDLPVKGAPRYGAPHRLRAPGEGKIADKLLLSIRQFGEVSGVGRTKIYALLKDGQLAGVKIGRRTYIKAVDAEAWLARLPAYRPDGQ